MVLNMLKLRSYICTVSMIKLYINQIPVILCSSEKLEKVFPHFGFKKEKVVLKEFRNQSEMMTLIRSAEQNMKMEALIFIHSDFEFLYTQFLKPYKFVEAAGGVVMNSDKKYLMIYRRGKWDLPKGGVEKGETIQKAAVREMMEETGLKGVSIVEPIKLYKLDQTYTLHTYREDNVRVLKKTNWFKMKATDIKGLKPQEEEGITETKWCDKNEVKKNLSDSYPGIIDVMDNMMTD